jgi:hypothetical protein
MRIKQCVKHVTFEKQSKILDAAYQMVVYYLKKGKMEATEKQNIITAIKKSIETTNNKY